MFQNKNHFLEEVSEKQRGIAPLSSNEKLQTVIIGSFRKHLSEIQKIRQKLELLDIDVLSPIDSVPINTNDEFIIFESDISHDPKVLQDGVFEKIKASSFVVIANVEGYIGSATLIEIGYTLALGIDLFALEPISNLHVKPYCKLFNDLLPFISHRTQFSETKIRELVRI